MNYYIKQINDWKRESEQANIGRSGKSYFGYVVTANPITESLQIGGLVGTRTSILHPYVGVSSWIRVIPESGTGMLLNAREDVATSGVLTYETGDSTERIKNYKEYKNLYRSLSIGEIELKSQGNSYSWLGNKVNINGSGMAYTMWDKDKLKIVNRSSRHIEQLWDNTEDLTNLKIFGVVKRENLVKKEEFFGKEYYCNFDNVTFHYGYITDAEGTPQQLKNSQMIYSENLNDNYLVKISEEGHVDITLKEIVHNSDKFVFKNDKHRISSKDILMNSNKITLKGSSLSIQSSNTEIKSSITDIQSSLIKLGQSASEGVVKGQTLATALTSLITILLGGSALADASVKSGLSSWLSTWGTPISSYISTNTKTL